MKNKKILNIITITMVSIVLLGNSTTDVYKKVRKNQSLINDVYRYLITNYVDNIDIDAFTKMSINNMLMELDPYTTYMENEEKDGIEMLTKGKYGGVGIQIGIREKQLTVISPMDNSPAKRAGILSGDKIIKIDDIETSSYKIDDAAKLIRGKQGTVVKLTIQRYGDSELIDFPLIRENIAVKDISYAGMLDKQNGYIRLTRFSRNSAKEMKLAIKDLLEKDMSGLILDLRDNPGGLLNSAVDILDLFIDKGETLVWTEGRSKKSFRKYNSNTIPLVPKDINVTVLVNKGSASASEIIAGTLQDLDRGVVIGRSTFGKGLVQTVFNIDRDRAIKITTAKYYIPSGRLIQRPGYLPTEILSDTTKADTVFFTKSGRVVSGAGGITPDHKVTLEDIKPILSYSWRNGLFFNFLQKNKMDYDSFDEVKNDSNLINKFEDYLQSGELDIYMKGENDYLEMREKLIGLDSTSIQIQGALDILDSYFEEIALTQFDRERNNIEHYLLVEFADFFLGDKGRVEISALKDRDIQKAISVLHDPVAYDRIFLPQ